MSRCILRCECIYCRPRAQHWHTQAISSPVSGSSSAPNMSLRLPPLQYLSPKVTTLRQQKQGWFLRLRMSALHGDPQVAAPAVAAHEIDDAFVVALLLHRKFRFYIVTKLCQ
jgi:hypothetical protein